jgi:hypothetical protein
MKKMKVILLSAAILIAVGGAFASKRDPLCGACPQYFKFGFNYYPAGEYGVDFICLTGLGTCTYYHNNPMFPNSFAPCRPGIYLPVIL